MIDPVRSSIWKDAEFQDHMKQKVPGFLETNQVTSPDAKIYFTPQPLFFNVTTDWAAALQQMVAKQIPVDEGLDRLAESTDRAMSDAGLD
jgi:multiple sugar transport system substrate-binding protein